MGVSEIVLKYRCVRNRFEKVIIFKSWVQALLVPEFLFTHSLVYLGHFQASMMKFFIKVTNGL